MPHCNKEKFKNNNNNNNVVNNATPLNEFPISTENMNAFSDQISNTLSNTTVQEFLQNGGTAVIIAIVLVLSVCLGISILLTIIGHKARIKCVDDPKYGFYSPLIITFLILMWLGNLVPPFTTAATVIGFIGTIVMIVLANDNCKK